MKQSKEGKKVKIKKQTFKDERVFNPPLLMPEYYLDIRERLHL